MHLAVTFFEHARRPAGAMRRPTWSDLSARLLEHRPAPALPWVCEADCAHRVYRYGGRCPSCRNAELVPDKRGLPAWSPWIFHDNAARSRSAATFASALVLDYDGTLPLDQVRERWAAWPHVGHTSWSHADPTAARARVVLPLEQPIAAAMWPRVWAWACAHDADHDHKCSDPGRIYFLPFLRPGRPHASWLHEDADRLLAIDPRALPAQPGEETGPRGEPSRRPGCDGDRSRDASTPPRVPRDPVRTNRWPISTALRDDPAMRRRLAELIGARVTGADGSERAKGAACPSCGQASVWWLIAPGRAVKAECDHRNTCGWSGFLDELAKASGLELRALRVAA